MKDNKFPQSLVAEKTAVIIIDIQNEYFNDGVISLPNAESASQVAKELLAWARKKNLMIIHVQHQAAEAGSPVFVPDTWNTEINVNVKPLESEIIIKKAFPSCFQGTNLNEILEAKKIKTLLVCGFMTHVCVDSTVREAFHRGYDVIIDNNACATRDLPAVNGGIKDFISHEVIHQSSLTALNDVFAHAVEHEQILSLAVN